MTPVDLQPAQQSHVPATMPPTSRMRIFLLSLILMLGVLAVYYPVQSQPFANYDDPDYVTDNVHVRAGLNWSTVKWAMTTRDAANWHPLTWLSHALDVQMFGIDAAGPHDVNVVLHAVNAFLLFWVLWSATGFVGRSWMVAALFALHPINVESVAWIAERKNLLSMLFFLLTLAAYRWYTLRPKDGRYLLVAILFGLGLMAKPQVITLPFVLLLWDYWPLQRFSFQPRSSAEAPDAATTPVKSAAALIWEKVPLIALCGLSAVMTLRAQAGSGATAGFAHTLRAENAIISYARYLGKAFWPSHLALFYPYPLQGYKPWQVGAAALLLLAISAGVVLGHRKRYLTVGWLWFLGTLIPMIGIVQVGLQAMADRYAYLPFIGLFIMICWFVAEWAAHIQPRLVLVRTVSVLVLTALALVAHRQVGYWDDHLTLWTHALDVTHNNWIAENNLGTELLKLGRPEEAIPHFRAAVADYPYDPNTILNLGIYEQMHGNFSAAIDWYEKAAGIARNPKTKARAYNNLAYAYEDRHDFPAARANLQKAVQVDPEFSGAWISLGLIAQRTGDLPMAIGAYSRGLAINSTDYGYLLLAGALDANGQTQQAKEARQRAALISTNIISAQRRADELLRR